MSRNILVKSGLLTQGLFVVFLWSAAKIAMKFGLATVSPFALVAIIQLVSALVFWAKQKFVRKGGPVFVPSAQELAVMIMIGVVTYAGANLFVATGLQYVTGSMAGLVATTTSIFGLCLAAVFLNERVSWLQLLGVATVVLGGYVFLVGDVLSGHWLGIGLLLVAEMAFAFGNVMTRFISVREDVDVAPVLGLIGNVLGAAIMLPLAIVSGQATSLIDQPVWLWVLILAVGIAYGYAGELWSKVLDKLRVVEVSVLANTMVIQVALLSVLFLGERLTAANILGGIIVLLGVLVVQGIVRVGAGGEKLQVTSDK